MGGRREGASRGRTDRARVREPLGLRRRGFDGTMEGRASDDRCAFVGLGHGFELARVWSREFDLCHAARLQQAIDIGLVHVRNRALLALALLLRLRLRLGHVRSRAHRLCRGLHTCCLWKFLRGTGGTLRRSGLSGDCVRSPPDDRRAKPHGSEYEASTLYQPCCAATAHA